MTEELKKIIFSPHITNIFTEHNWNINTDTKNKFYFYFVGEIADYYLNIYNDKNKIYLGNKINNLWLRCNSRLAEMQNKEYFFNINRNKN